MDQKKTAWKIIVLFGLVSLFGDIVYEGARGVNGQYLEILGASALVVGIVAGLGEFLGYAIRLLAGYISDKTRSYWLFTFLGYGLLLGIPLLCFIGAWQAAIVFILFERIGRGLRNPARDTILSQATHKVGTGIGFGLHEAMDQVGAVLGPLIFAGLFFILDSGSRSIKDYQLGYAFLWLPFVLLMFCLIYARKKAADTDILDLSAKPGQAGDKLTKVFWLYASFSFMTTLGFASFALIGYHLKVKNILSDAQIPMIYALAMIVDAAAALAIGKAYDETKKMGKNGSRGLIILIVIPALTFIAIPLVFAADRAMAISGAVIWGIVMGCHETIMRSAIADITPLAKRGTGYGILNLVYGAAFFAGGTLMGMFYAKALTYVIMAAMCAQVLSLPLFFAMRKEVLKDE